MYKTYAGWDFHMGMTTRSARRSTDTLKTAHIGLASMQCIHEYVWCLVLHRHSHIRHRRSMVSRAPPCSGVVTPMDRSALRLSAAIAHYTTLPTVALPATLRTAIARHTIPFVN